MSKTGVRIILCLIAILVGLLILTNNVGKTTLLVAGKTFNLEVARTDYELERGLSFHKPLLDNEGMLFVFPKSGKYGFWMKDMTFPIDIVWIGSDFTIKDIKRGVLPETYPNIFYPESESQYVLEVSAGQSDLLRLKIGERVKFSKNFF